MVDIKIDPNKDKVVFHTETKQPVRETSCGVRYIHGSPGYYHIDLSCLNLKKPLEIIKNSLNLYKDKE